MKIYNSLTDKLEEFIPIEEGKVSMYVCGPTVYNYVHIGNLRPVITFDMVFNYFKYLGYEVTYASNFTDINPKITMAAKELAITEREVAERFINAYLEDLRNYNCSEITYRPKVVNHLDDIFNFIDALLKKDYAYIVDGDVYFRVSKIKDYGILSNQDINELQAGKRMEIDEKKEDPLDFALWRKSDDGEVFESPWGKGIPGWHTECVVMINALFGNRIDIHGGGVDLKFPHHENEIAQSIALNDNYLANYWMHNGHINLDGIKMSKSLGNFVLARDFIKEHEPNVIKIALFKTHYRLPLNFTDSLWEEAIIVNDKIKSALKQANLIINMDGLEKGLVKKDEKIESIMNEDFNTPNLISYLSELLKDINIKLRNKDDFIKEYDTILIIANILGLKYDLKDFNEEDKELYNKWLVLKSEKNFEEADKIRTILMEKGLL